MAFINWVINSCYDKSLTTKTSSKWYPLEKSNVRKRTNLCHFTAIMRGERKVMGQQPWTGENEKDSRAQEREEIGERDLT